MQKVKFYCGMYRSVGDWGSEAAECCAEGAFEVEPQEWEEGSVSHVCPSCGIELYQCDDHFELEGVNDHE